MVIEFPWWVYLLVLWSLVWKAVAGWKAARNKQLPWFISFFIFNTAGILPMIYLFWFQDDWNAGIPDVLGRGRSRKRVSRKKR